MLIRPYINIQERASTKIESASGVATDDRSLINFLAYEV